jgi:hypothetical protein
MLLHTYMVEGLVSVWGLFQLIHSLFVPKLSGLVFYALEHFLTSEFDLVGLCNFFNRGMDMSTFFALSCIGTGLAMGQSPIEGALPTCLNIFIVS